MVEELSDYSGIRAKESSATIVAERCIERKRVNNKIVIIRVNNKIIII